ncbi:MAG: NACHT domain-containing protein, partial [Thermodesulfobacteriota bacterium]
EPMPPDVIDYFIDYGSARGGQKEELRIPEEYRRWLSEQCEKMDISRLMSPGRPITINLPEVFILLYASPPVKKQPLNPRSIEMGHEPVDIEELAAGNRYLVVEGQAGSGKTTLLKHLAYCIMEKQGYKGLGKYLPVLVFLKDMPNIKTKKKITASSATAERYLSQYFDETANGLDIATVKRFCEADKAIFLIDGLDEIDPEMRMTLVDSLACFRSRYNTCKMVLCSRPHGVDGTVMRHFGENRVVILSLNETQVKGFIKVWFEHIYNRSTIGEKTSEGMISDIKSHQNIKELLETPLMLTAICILYYDERELPGQRADLYRKFIDHLLYKRFGSEKERVHNYLMELAFKQHEKEARRFNKVFALETMRTIYPQGESETGDEYRRRLEKRFDEIEQNCGLLKLKDGQYEFWHLTFQEFLTATYIVAKRYNYSEAIQGYWDNKWYHEVIELFIGLLSIQNSGWANKIVSDELSKEDQPPFIRWRLASRSLLGIHRDSREPRVLEHAGECLLSLFDSGGDPEILVDAG